MKKIDILGVLVDHTDMNGALARCEAFLQEEGSHVVYTPNSEIIMMAYHDPGFCKTVNSADLIVPDGIGVVYASRILKAPLPERVAGFDLSSNLIEKAAEKAYSLYFFGGKPGVAEKAPEAYQKAGLEWLYRLKKEPSRFFRMMALPKFGFTVLFKGKRCPKEKR